MQKIGEVKLDTGDEYFLIWYSDNNGNERIDIFSDPNTYNVINTMDCVSSYIKGRDERYFGNDSIVRKVIGTKYKASVLAVKENKSVGVEDGSFVMCVTKESEEMDVFYQVKTVNGKIAYEEYKADNIDIIIKKVGDEIYVSSAHPINWDEYVVANEVAVRKYGEIVKRGQAEFYSYEELLRRYPQVHHVLENDYVVIRSYEEAVERLNIWINSKVQLKSYDIESLSTDWGPTSSNRITGVFLGFGYTWSTYFPFRQENFQYNLPIEFLRTIFEAINNQPAYPEVIMMAYNSKFEIQGFYHEYPGEYIRLDVDPYLEAVLIDPVIRKGSHTLKNFTARVDNRFYLDLSKHIFIGPVQFNVLTEDVVKLYGCPDATSPAKVHDYCMQRLPKDERAVCALENKLPTIKAMNEYFGIRIDWPLLLKFIENEEYKVNMLGDLFRKIHHTSRNINSSQVLLEIIYDKLRCKVEVRTDKGQPATSKVAIDRIVATGKKDINTEDKIPEDIKDKNGETIISGKDLASNKYPSLVIYQKYKKCVKELGALRRIRDRSVNGYFKFYINQVGAGSNRQTSDAHQFSDTMKKLVKADSPHHKLCSCDWKQIELRILAGMAHQEDLMELEADCLVDIHRAILSIIQGKPMFMISEEDRKAGKSVNFGVVYMMSEYGLANKDYGPAYTKEQLNIERKKIMDFFNGMPSIKKFLAANEEYLKTHGFIKTLFKYYRYFPELLDPTTDPKLVKRLIRSGNNTPVQGTGASLMKIAETLVWEKIREKGWDKLKDYDGIMLPMARMILPIHDEILFSFDESIPVEEIICMFKECMELDVKGLPPLFAAPAFIDNWYQGKDSNYEVDIPFRDKVVEEYAKGNMLLTGHDYLGVLTEFRDNQLREYMEDLIAKYKEPDLVAQHVTHPAHTHTLIEIMIKNKDERKKLTHIERIYEAARRYMAALEDKGTLEAIKSREVEIESDEEKIDIDEWALNYTHIDATGELITEDVPEDEISYYLGNQDYEEYNWEVDNAEVPRVVYLMSECLIDFTGIDMNTEGEEINKRLQMLFKSTAYYNVVYVLKDKPINTKFKVDYIPDEINNVFKEVLEGRLIESNG